MEQKYRQLKNRIDAVRRKQKVVALIRGGLFFLWFVVVASLLSTVLEALFKFDVWGRTVISGMFWLSAGLVLLLMFIKALYSFLFKKSDPDDVEIARHIGVFFHDIADKLSNALQLYRIRAANETGYSTQLIDQSLERIHQASRNLDFTKSVSYKAIRRQLRWLGAAMLIAFIFYGVWGKQLLIATDRLLNPFSSYERVPQISIQVFPGSKQVLKNESVSLTAKVSGQRINKIDVHLREINDEYHLKQTLTAGVENDFHFLIQNIQDTTEYYFSHQGMTTEKHILAVIELPLVRRMQIYIIPPAYTGLSEQRLQENVGDISCLKGSKVEFDLTANKGLTEASIDFGKQQTVALQTNDNHASGSFSVFQDDVYKIKLIDNQAFENRDPILYRISLIDDIFPNVAISSPGRDVDLTEELILPLTIEAEDDFGFTILRLGYHIDREDDPFPDTTLQFQPLNFDPSHQERLTLEYNWDLKSLNLFPGDVVRYYAEVFDNDRVSGPKSARSRTYFARFPTLAEIFAQVDAEQETAYESFEGLYEKSTELKQHVDRLVQEIKQNPEVNWEGKKKIEDIVRNQEKLETSLQEIQQQLDQMIERMEKNDLLSLETLQKYNELQKLLNEILTDDLKQALKKLQKAAEQIDEKLLKQAVEQLNLSQEDFLKNIEKTLNMLKQIQVERKLDELIKKTEELLMAQQNINERLNEDYSENQASDVCKDQQKTQQKADELLQETDGWKNDLSESGEEPQQAIAEVLDLAEHEGLLQNMQQVQKSVRSGDTQTAQKSGDSAQGTLSQMVNMLSQTRREMVAKQKQEIMRELSRLSHNLLQLSHKQESLIQTTQKLNANSPQLTQKADRQQDLQQALTRNANQMAALSQKTFFVSAQMGRFIGQAMRNMDEALSQFGERNITAAARNQRLAMINLNETVKQIMSAMKQLEQSSSASGLEEMMEQLSQMAGQQQGINDQTLQLGAGQQSFSLSQQAAMARLAAEQEALRKSIEQLQREYGERSDVLGRLDHLGKEMEDVVKDLQQQNISRRTINRQQQILQRLLDAQKSARKQDYSRKRKGETGKYYPAINPGALPDDLGEKNSQIQRDLLRALKEGYTKDYQDLIKKYFDALIKESDIDNDQKN